MPLSSHSLTKTDDGSYTLKHAEHGETFHSISGAWSESQAVYLRPFLEYSELSKTPNWSVLDVGFGLGLNWLSYVDYFLSREIAGVLSLISIENDAGVLPFDLPHDGVASHLRDTNSLTHLKRFKSQGVVQTEKIQARLMLKDIKLALADLIDQGHEFDVILYDPFSPQKNPLCWDMECFELLARCVKIGSIVLTYSVAGHVRRGLAAAGFDVMKYPGFGKKREQLVAKWEAPISKDIS